MRFNRWRYQPQRRFINLDCLCVVCYQEKKSKPGSTPSDYDCWCDECFVDLPLWLKFEKTTTEELEQLAQRQKDAADSRRQKREEKARAVAAKAKKKVKLTGFENVEDEDSPITLTDAEVTEVKTNYEEERIKLESIFHYESDD